MREAAALAAALLGVFLTQLDVGLVAVTLPAVARSYPGDVANAQGVVVTYLAFLALGVIPFGNLADRWSRAGVFRIGLAAFALGSLVVGFGPDFATVLFGRALQGVGAAAAVGVGQALAFATGGEGRSGRNLGLAHMAVAAGLAAGPVVGGLLLDQVAWQRLFLLEPPLALVAALLASDARSPQMSRRGASPRALLRRELLIGLAIAALAFVAMSANMFVIPLFLQRPLALAASTAGLLMAIVPLAILVVAPLAGALADRLGSRVPATAGLALVAVAIASFALAAGTVLPIAVAPPLALYGLGAALFQSPNNRAVLAAAPEGQLALASGLLAVSRQLGQIVGVWVSGALLQATARDVGGANSYALTFFILAAVALVTAGLSATRGT